MIRCEPSCEGFFRHTRQKPQEILDGFPRIFVKYDGNKTRSFGHEESLEVPKRKNAHFKEEILP